MSNADTFKYRGPDKRAPFPFNRDVATAPAGPYDYVVLASLQEACDIWWRLESISLEATFTYDSSPVEMTLAGSGAPWPGDRVEYTSRQVPPTNGFTFSYTGPSTGYVFYEYSPYPYLELHVAYASGEWRLYYRLDISIAPSNDPTLDDWVFYNLAVGYHPWYYTDTGTFSLLGKTFSYRFLSLDPIETPHSITASSTFYTLV